MATPSSSAAASMCARRPALATSPTTAGTPASSLLRPRPPPPQRHLLQLRTHHRRRPGSDLRCRRRLMTARGERPNEDDEEDDEQEHPAAATAAGFDAAVALFNRGEYHACHDVVEELWYGAEDPARTLLHGILQCAVGFHHLFNQNHRGAMMELGEGLCKLRKLHHLDGAGPFAVFRDEVADVLQFLYRTQKELAACTDELCLTMDGSPSSYQLLGNFAAGQRLYRLEAADGDAAADGGANTTSWSNIVFSASTTAQAVPLRVKVPTLHATEQHLARLQCTYEYM